MLLERNFQCSISCCLQFTLRKVLKFKKLHIKWTKYQKAQGIVTKTAENSIQNIILEYSIAKRLKNLR